MECSNAATLIKYLYIYNPNIWIIIKTVASTELYYQTVASTELYYQMAASTELYYQMAASTELYYQMATSTEPITKWRGAGGTSSLKIFNCGGRYTLCSCG